ncbi:MAG: hypothetical protein JSU73_11465, partial [candidate division WOR-3 bacterium]
MSRAGPLFLLLSISACVAMAEWTSVGPPAGPLYAAAAGSDHPPTIYAATLYYPMPVARSTDGGETWRFTGGVLSTYSSEMVVDPGNSDVVYAIVSGRVRKTTDAGESWTLVPTPADLYITGFDLNPLNPAVVYISASCSSRVVVGRSTDAGATWRSFVCDSTEGR